MSALTIILGGIFFILMLFAASIIFVIVLAIVAPDLQPLLAPITIPLLEWFMRVMGIQ